METIKVKLIADVPEPAWCAGKKGQIFEVYDTGLDYNVNKSGIGRYLRYDQCEIITDDNSDSDNGQEKTLNEIIAEFSDAIEIWVNDQKDISNIDLAHANDIYKNLIKIAEERGLEL